MSFMIGPGSNELAALIPSATALDRFVYLVGPVRSGTSILQNAMKINPASLVLPRVTHFVQHVWRNRWFVQERLLRQIIRLGPAWDQTAIESRLNAEQRAAFIRMVNSAFASRDIAQLYKLIPCAYALSGSNTKPLGGIVSWQDKSNDWRYIGTLAKSFPSSRFIFLVRDPRSVVLSGAGRMALKAGEMAPNLDDKSIVSMSLYWRMMCQRFLDFGRRYPSRCRIVRYEDFTANPVMTLKSLFEFSSDGSPALDMIAESVAQLGGGATIDLKEAYKGISQAATERWKAAMSREQIQLVAELTGPTAQKLGYDLPQRRLGAMSGAQVAARGGRRGMANVGKLAAEEFYEFLISPPSPAIRVLTPVVQNNKPSAISP